VTALAISAVAYGAWQAWWLSAIGLGAVLVVGILLPSPKGVAPNSVCPFRDLPSEKI
jgi:hypothetical protein